MKTKILKIDGEEWIKKFHYDAVKKSKIKTIYEKQNHKTPTNPENTLAVFSWEQKESIERLMGDMIEFKGELSFRGFGDDKHPKIIINNTAYGYNYFIQAERIARALGYSEDYTIFISKKDCHPILLDFEAIKIIIAPRIDYDANCESSEVKE